MFKQSPIITIKIQFLNLVVRLLKINNYHLLLVIIILVGGFLRLYKLHNHMWWFPADSSRDILVAKHIVEFKEQISTGPYAYGSKNKLKNSPVYFYLLALFWIISKTPIGVTYCIAFLNSIVILLGYKIGKFLKNENTGIIIATLFSLSSILVNYSKGIFQPHLLVFFFTFSLWVYLKSSQHVSLRWLSLYIISIFLLLHIHYSILSLFPVMFAMGIYRYKKILEKKYILGNLIIPPLLVTLLLVTWVMFSVNINALSSDFSFIIGFVGQVLSSDFFIKILQNFQIFSIALFPLKNTYLSSALLISLLVALVFKIIVNCDKKNQHYSVVLISLILSFLFTGLLQNDVDPLHYYFVPYYILVPVIAGYAISQIKSKLIIFILTTFLLLLSYGNNYNFLSPRPPTSSLLISSNIAHAIWNDYQQSQQQSSHGKNVKLSINTVIEESANNYHDTAIWFFLEKLFDLQLVTLVSGFNNIQPLNVSYDHFYIICYSHQNTKFAVNCLYNYDQNGISSEIFKELYSFTEGTSTYKVYRRNL